MGLVYRANHFVTCRLPLKLARSQLSRPLASVTFDDFPKSAWTVGGPLLARYGARATYYAAGRFRGVEEEGIAYYDDGDLHEIVAAGHEVGAHSYAHEPAPSRPTHALADDAARNAEALEAVVGQRLTSYAYPFGEISPRTKAVMGARFACARGIRPGVNAGTIDLAQLKAVGVEWRSFDEAAVAHQIDRAVAETGWVVFFTHDVSETPTPYGCTPAMLAFVLERLTRAGIEVLPVRQAMARAVFGS